MNDTMIDVFLTMYSNLAVSFYLFPYGVEINF